MTSDTRTVRARRWAARTTPQQQPAPPAEEPVEHAAADDHDPTLAELGIPARYHDELESAGIQTLADLQQAGDLTVIRGIGPKAQAEIEAAVAAYTG